MDTLAQNYHSLSGVSQPESESESESTPTSTSIKDTINKTNNSITNSLISNKKFSNLNSTKQNPHLNRPHHTNNISTSSYASAESYSSMSTTTQNDDDFRVSSTLDDGNSSLQTSTTPSIREFQNQNQNQNLKNVSSPGKNALNDLQAIDFYSDSGNMMNHRGHTNYFRRSIVISDSLNSINFQAPTRSESENSSLNKTIADENSSDIQSNNPSSRLSTYTISDLNTLESPVKNKRQSMLSTSSSSSNLNLNNQKFNSTNSWNITNNNKKQNEVPTKSLGITNSPSLQALESILNEKSTRNKRKSTMSASLSNNSIKPIQEDTLEDTNNTITESNNNNNTTRNDTLNDFSTSSIYSTVNRINSTKSKQQLNSTNTTKNKNLLVELDSDIVGDSNNDDDLGEQTSDNYDPVVNQVTTSANNVNLLDTPILVQNGLLNNNNNNNTNMTNFQTTSQIQDLISFSPIQQQQQTQKPKSIQINSDNQLISNETTNDDSVIISPIKQQSPAKSSTTSNIDTDTDTFKEIGYDSKSENEGNYSDLFLNSTTTNANNNNNTEDIKLVDDSSIDIKKDHDFSYDYTFENENTPVTLGIDHETTQNSKRLSIRLVRDATFDDSDSINPFELGPEDDEQQQQQLRQPEDAQDTNLVSVQPSTVFRGPPREDIPIPTVSPAPTGAAPTKYQNVISHINANANNRKSMIVVSTSTANTDVTDSTYNTNSSGIVAPIVSKNLETEPVAQVSKRFRDSVLPSVPKINDLNDTQSPALSSTSSSHLKSYQKSASSPSLLQSNPIRNSSPSLHEIMSPKFGEETTSRKSSDFSSTNQKRNSFDVLRKSEEKSRSSFDPTSTPARFSITSPAMAKSPNNFSKYSKFPPQSPSTNIALSKSPGKKLSSSETQQQKPQKKKSFMSIFKSNKKSKEIGPEVVKTEQQLPESTIKNNGKHSPTFGHPSPALSQNSTGSFGHLKSKSFSSFENLISSNKKSSDNSSTFNLNTSTADLNDKKQKDNKKDNKKDKRKSFLSGWRRKSIGGSIPTTSEPKEKESTSTSWYKKSPLNKSSPIFDNTFQQKTPKLKQSGDVATKTFTTPNSTNATPLLKKYGFDSSANRNSQNITTSPASMSAAVMSPSLLTDIKTFAPGAPGKFNDDASISTSSVTQGRGVLHEKNDTISMDHQQAEKVSSNGYDESKIDNNKDNTEFNKQAISTTPEFTEFSFDDDDEYQLHLGFTPSPRKSDTTKPFTLAPPIQGRLFETSLKRDISMNSGLGINFDDFELPSTPKAQQNMHMQENQLNTRYSMLSTTSPSHQNKHISDDLFPKHLDAEDVTSIVTLERCRSVKSIRSVSGQSALDEMVSNPNLNSIVTPDGMTVVRSPVSSSFRRSVSNATSKRNSVLKSPRRSSQNQNYNRNSMDSSTSMPVSVLDAYDNKENSNNQFSKASNTLSPFDGGRKEKTIKTLAPPSNYSNSKLAPPPTLKTLAPLSSNTLAPSVAKVPDIAITDNDDDISDLLAMITFDDTLDSVNANFSAFDETKREESIRNLAALSKKIEETPMYNRNPEFAAQQRRIQELEEILRTQQEDHIRKLREEEEMLKQRQEQEERLLKQMKEQEIQLQMLRKQQEDQDRKQREIQEQLALAHKKQMQQKYSEPSPVDSQRSFQSPAFNDEDDEDYYEEQSQKSDRYQKSQSYSSQSSRRNSRISQKYPQQQYHQQQPQQYQQQYQQSVQQNRQYQPQHQYEQQNYNSYRYQNQEPPRQEYHQYLHHQSHYAQNRYDRFDNEDIDSLNSNDEDIRDNFNRAPVFNNGAPSHAESGYYQDQNGYYDDENDNDYEDIEEEDNFETESSVSRPVSMSFKGLKGPSFNSSLKATTKSAILGSLAHSTGSHTSIYLPNEESESSLAPSPALSSDAEFPQAQQEQKQQERQSGATPRYERFNNNRSSNRNSMMINTESTQSKKKALTKKKTHHSKNSSSGSLSSISKLNVFNRSATSLSSQNKQQAQTPERRSVKFSSRILLYDTYDPEDYDRKPDVATCNQLTPQLAQQIKDELNDFKAEMTIHEDSRCYTHFF
ncbi:hypothetical protein B5S31_g2734 [[Candida] boidinii]|nr:hypothetical protein B5S31_g2734 [[Candida] boidinii]